MTLSLIVAVARNGVIGRDGDLPWRLPEDMKAFRRITLGHHVIMGRKTWESLSKPLVSRVNVVVTRQSDYVATGATVVHSLEDAVTLATSAGDDEAFIIGGSSLYEEALPLVRHIYLTRVDADVPGDTTFPLRELDREWSEVKRRTVEADERHPYAFHLCQLERRGPGIGPTTSP